MAQLSPFVGLLFDRSRVGSLDRVTAPPYDVIGPEDRRRYLEASPFNVVRLDLGEAHAGDGEDDKYRAAASTLRSWREQGVLAQTAGPAAYPYEMRFELRESPRRIRGSIVAVELEDWGGSIVPHERTMEGPVEDRLRLMRAVHANLSSIHAVFTGPSADFSRHLDEGTAGEPAALAVDEEGVEHRLWIGDLDPTVTAALAAGSLMIADGHHRYTTALRYRDEMREAHGPGPWDRVMVLVVDAATEDPPVLPIHRVVRAGAVPDVGTPVRDLHEILEAVDDRTLRVGVVTNDDDRLAYGVTELNGVPPAVSALHRGVLAGADASLEFTHDASIAEDSVRRGSAVAAYILPATDAASIRAVIDRGDRLPQKSTFFWPKPRTGMVIRPLDDELVDPASAG